MTTPRPLSKDLTDQGRWHLRQVGLDYMPDAWHKVKEAQDRLGLSNNALAEIVAGEADVSPSTVYRSLAGRTDTSTDVLGELLKAVGLEIVAIQEPADRVVSD